LVQALGYKSAIWIPKEVIEIFHLLSPSGRTMALGSTQPLTDVRRRSVSWG